MRPLFFLSFLVSGLLALSTSAYPVPAIADPPTHLEDFMHGTYKLFNSSSTATCFLMKDPDTAELLLITAAHVLEKSKGNECLLVIRVQDEQGKWSRKDVPIQVREDDKVLWTKHPKLDLAVLLLKEQIPNAHPISLKALMTLEQWKQNPVRLNDRAHILCYPARVESSSAGFPVSRSAGIAGYPNFPKDEAPDFLLDFSSSAGDSGGPVIFENPKNADQPMQIIGLVISQILNNEQVESEFERRNIRRPLYLSRAIYSSYIHDTIALARSTTESPSPNDAKKPEEAAPEKKMTPKETAPEEKPKEEPKPVAPPAPPAPPEPKPEPKPEAKPAPEPAPAEA